MFRNSLLGSTILRNKPEDGGAAAPVPAVDVPAAAPVVVEPAAPAPEPAPAAEPAPAPAAEKVDAHATETLLEGAGKEPAAAEPAKAAEPAPADHPKPADAGEAKPAEPAPAPVAPVYDLKLPEGITAAPEAMSAFTEMLGTNKIAPEVGQAFLDRHVAEMTRYADHLAQEQHKAFSDTRAQWREQVTSDPEIGGAGHKTAMTAIATVRDALVPKSEAAAFNEFLRVTGAGDNPQFLKMMHRAAKLLNEPGAPAQQGNPSPTNGQRPGGRGLKSIYADTAAKRAAS